MRMKIMTLCYVKKDNKTLMLHRSKRDNDIHKGKWNGLGGKFEAGESPEDCVIREVKEESGLDINGPKLAGILSFPGFMDDDLVVFVYTVKDFSGELIESDEGDLEWIPDDKLLDLELWESDKYFLRWIEQGKLFSAKFNYDKDKMIDYEVFFH